MTLSPKALLGLLGARSLHDWPRYQHPCSLSTQDDPIYLLRAADVVERRLTAENPGFVSIVAMVETVWVLDRAYRLRAREIAATIERLLQAETLVLENEQEVFSAMIALKEGRGSFADGVIAALGAKAGCVHTLTFDEKALRFPGFRRA